MTNTATRTGTPTITATPTITPTFTVTFTATITPTPPALANDVCSGATLVTSVPYTATQNTSTATTEPSDPSPSCGNHSAAKSVWYRFTAPGAGTIMADTFGSNYDTLLSVYTGACAALTAVPGACNDDAPATVQSQVIFNASGGTTYFFLVAAYGGVSDTLVFHLSFQAAGPTATVTVTPTATSTPSPSSTPIAGMTHTPTPTPLSPGGAPNDACANAAVISALPYTDAVSTSMATTEGTDPVPGCGNGSRSRSVWYRFTAAGAGTITADTLGSSYDTVLSVYTGACATFTPVGCNDDAPAAVQSKISFAANGGTTYFFLVTAYNGDGGSLAFHLSTAP